MIRKNIKFKDATEDELYEFCDKQTSCDDCPLYRSSSSSCSREFYISVDEKALNLNLNPTSSDDEKVFKISTHDDIPEVKEMTSEEAFKQYKKIYVDKTFEGDTCPAKEWYESIINEDLKILEILKNHLQLQVDYVGDSEYATHTIIRMYWDNLDVSVDSDIGKEHNLVKTWITKRGKNNGSNI